MNGGSYNRRGPAPLEPDTTVTLAFLTGMFSATEGMVYLSSLPNSEDREDQPGEKRVSTRDPDTVVTFVRKYAIDRRGSFFTPNTILQNPLAYGSDGCTRLKANVSEINCVYVDVDPKGVTISIEEVILILRDRMEFPPTAITLSGSGIHVYWKLREPVTVEPGDPEGHIARFEELNRSLCDLLGGDTAAIDILRLLRLPGTFNTKSGARKLVEVYRSDWNRLYEVDDLEDMAAGDPLIERRPEVQKKVRELNAFEAFGSEAGGWKPALDVEAELASIVRGVNGHPVALRVMMSMLNHGVDTEEIVRRIVEAAMRTADPAKYTLARTEKSIRSMLKNTLRRHKGILEQGAAYREAQVEREALAAAARGEAVEAAPEPKPKPVAVEPVAATAMGANVDYRLAEKIEKQKAAKATKNADAGATADTIPKAKQKPLAPIVVDGVLHRIRGEGRDLLLTGGSMWIYGEGVWTAVRTEDEQSLRVMVNRTLAGMKMMGDMKLAGASWKLLNEYPDIHHQHVDWDSGDLVVCGNGVLNILTREFGPFDPKHYCRQKIGTNYEPGAECPVFLRFLEGCWPDHSAEDRRGIIDLLQEFFGSMLAVKRLAREQRKALFLKGESRTGKTQISTVAKHLIGKPIGTPSISDIGKEFGMASLLGTRAWIRDDAVSEGDVLDPARFKAIVTGEDLDVNSKNRMSVSIGFEIPVLLTANALPAARDASDAIYNRSLVIEMNNVMSEEQAVAACRALGFGDAKTLADDIAKLEAPGILNWALEGLERLLARGRYNAPEIVNSALRQFREGNNPAVEFASTCLATDPNNRIDRADLMATYNAWHSAEQGAGTRAAGFRALKPRLQAIFPGIDVNVSSNCRRYVGGIRLTPEGLNMWQVAYNDGGGKLPSDTKIQVNQACLKSAF